MDLPSFEKRLEALEAAVAALERRVGATRRRAPSNAPEAPDAVSSAQALEDSGLFSGLFVRMATAIFALLGALALREATRQQIFAAWLGATTGYCYCALLLAAPLVSRRIRRLRTGATLLQYCGLSLAPLIILEMAPRMHLEIAETAVMLAAIGFAGALAGVLSRAGGLVGYGQVVCLLAIAGLGLGPQSVVLRGILVLAQLAVAAVLAHRKGWSALRPLVWPIGGLVLFLLVVAVVRNGGTAGAYGLAAVILAAWLLVLASSVLRATLLSPGEAAWLPVAALWAYGLLVLLTPAILVPAALFVGAVAWAVGLTLLWRKPGVPRLAHGLVTMGALLQALVLPTLDSTGMSLAVLAVLTGAVASRGHNRLLAGLASFLVLGAACRAVLSHWLSSSGGSGLVSVVASGLALTALVLVQAWFVRDRTPLANQRLRGIPVSLSLLVAVVVLASTFEAALSVIAQPGELRRLSETVALAVMALGLAYAGRALGNLALRVTGLAAIGVLAMLVVVRDLSQLTGWRLLASVVTVGTTFLGVSFTLRGGGASKQARDEIPERGSAG